MTLLRILEGGCRVRELPLEIDACRAFETEEWLIPSCTGDRVRDHDGKIAGQRVVPGNVKVSRWVE
jgi:hypothetical protein